jgi:SAM-dependent methyltransferase
MRRLNLFELEKILQCPYCHGAMELTKSSIACAECRMTFMSFRGRPVLIRGENELFPPSAYAESQASPDGMIEKRGRLGRLKSLLPSTSVNVARERMFHRISVEHASGDEVILVIGCGNQVAQLQRHFSAPNTIFIFCDIDKNADADMFCDAHELPFRNDIFHGVISTAVLEHVLYPDTVVSEIHRILKQDGFIYSEIPFLQSVHEGAYDFTRFTMSGHRRLFEYFEEVDAGMVAGPGTALVWSIVDFSKSMFANTRVSSLFAFISRAIFFWLKYFDHLMKENPIAFDAASCTYFYGRRQESRVPAETIIDKYHCKVFKHT